MTLRENHTIFFERHKTKARKHREKRFRYYPFGLEMKAISSTAAMKQQTNYKFNAGTELEASFLFRNVSFKSLCASFSAMSPLRAFVRWLGGHCGAFSTKPIDFFYTLKQGIKKNYILQMNDPYVEHRLSQRAMRY